MMYCNNGCSNSGCGCSGCANRYTYSSNNSCGCSSCGCANSGSSCGCGCSGCSSCSGSTSQSGCGCQCSSGSCGCSSSGCGCGNSSSQNGCGCSSGSGCGCGCGNNCVHTRLSTTLPLSGACRICGSSITVNSVQTALISGRYVASINYTVTVTYLNHCGSRRSATTTQTTQTYLPCSCTNTNNLRVYAVSKNVNPSCCGACFTAILAVCC